MAKYPPNKIKPNPANPDHNCSCQERKKRRRVVASGDCKTPREPSTAWILGESHVRINPSRDKERGEAQLSERKIIEKKTGAKGGRLRSAHTSKSDNPGEECEGGSLDAGTTTKGQESRAGRDDQLKRDTE